jgi:hypothetical protein
MSHKRVLPVDVVLVTMKCSPVPLEQYDGNFSQFQRDMLPA